MSIDALFLLNFRNIAESRLSLESGLNLFVGDNGAGKSSVLEAVHVLGTGKSFRVGSHRPLIRFGQESFVVSGVTHQGLRVGLERSADGRAQVIIGDRRVRSASELARELPVMAITLSDFRLFEDGPRIRRRFLDWGVYHFFPQDAPQLFHRFGRAMKQRNFLLKNDTIDRSERLAWEREFTESGEALNALRSAYMQRLESAFAELFAEFNAVEAIPEPDIELLSGWPSGESLSEAVQSQRVREQERRYRRSMVGPQRADVRFLTGKQPVQDIFSRGQLKVLGHLLKLSQVRLLHENSGGVEPLILLDDLTAELDQGNLNRMLRELGKTGFQVFISSLTADQIRSGLSEETKIPVRVFHVEQGTVRVVE